MPNILLISDLHLGHTNILGFTNPDSSLLRPGFANIDEHDTFVIDYINKIVKPEDRLIIVGDAVMNKRNMFMMHRINGKKTLVMGNHDPTDPEYLTPYFEKISGALQLDQFIVTHIPVHPNQLEYRFKGNIHGHLHGHPVLEKFGKADTRYFNVSVESLKYIPISLEEIKKLVP
jgi:calcineurin-like phosphoesterase family protein